MHESALETVRDAVDALLSGYSTPKIMSADMSRDGVVPYSAIRQAVRKRTPFICSFNTSKLIRDTLFEATKTGVLKQLEWSKSESYNTRSWLYVRGTEFYSFKHIPINTYASIDDYLRPLLYLKDNSCVNLCPPDAVEQFTIDAIKKAINKRVGLFGFQPVLVQSLHGDMWAVRIGKRATPMYDGRALERTISLPPNSCTPICSLHGRVHILEELKNKLRGANDFIRFNPYFVEYKDTMWAVRLDEATPIIVEEHPYV